MIFLEKFLSECMIALMCLNLSLLHCKLLILWFSEILTELQSFLAVTGSEQGEAGE